MTPDQILTEEFERLVEETGIHLSLDDCHCGVNRFMPKWLRKILSVRFNISCAIHDLHHNSGVVDMKTADLLFLKNVKLQAGESIYWKCNAYLFYMFVKVYTLYKRIR